MLQYNYSANKLLHCIYSGLHIVLQYFSDICLNICPISFSVLKLWSFFSLCVCNMELLLGLHEDNNIVTFKYKMMSNVEKDIMAEKLLMQISSCFFVTYPGQSECVPYLSITCWPPEVLIQLCRSVGLIAPWLTEY